jgi:hypothetical protein
LAPGTASSVIPAAGSPGAGVIAAPKTPSTVTALGIDP